MLHVVDITINYTIIGSRPLNLSISYYSPIIIKFILKIIKIVGCHYIIWEVVPRVNYMV